MTPRRRAWVARFRDSKAMADLLRAARECMADACDDPPAECAHAVNRMTPLEFAEWVEREVLHADQDGPTRMVRELNSAAAIERRDQGRLRAVPA